MSPDLRQRVILVALLYTEGQAPIDEANCYRNEPMSMEAKPKYFTIPFVE